MQARVAILAQKTEDEITADYADFADLRSRTDGLCHLQFCSG